MPSALTGIERANSQSSSVQLGLTQSSYVLFVRRRPRRPRHGRLASSLGRHLHAAATVQRPARVLPLLLAVDGLTQDTRCAAVIIRVAAVPGGDRVRAYGEVRS